MEKDVNKQIKIGLIVTISGTVIGSIILTLFESIRKIIFDGVLKLLKLIKLIFSTMWNFLITSHDINGFIIVLSILAWIFFIFILFFLIKESILEKTYINYKEDVFYNIKWQWNWKSGFIENLSCFCTKCYFEISCIESHDIYTDNYGLNFNCEHCNNNLNIKNYNFNQFIDIIKKEIRRKIRVGEKPDNTSKNHTQP